MLIRYGLAHFLSFLAALPVFFVLVRGSAMIVPDGAVVRRSILLRALAKIMTWTGVASLILVPCIIFTVFTIVRVVDDGPGNTLTWRRYLMIGGHATATTAGGGRIVITNKPGEITVNATKGPLVMVPKAYGYGQEPLPEAVRLEPGDTAAFVNLPIFLGEPPSSVEVSSNTYSLKQVYIERTQ